MDTIILGDFNTDLSRRSKHTTLLIDFAKKNNLIFYDTQNQNPVNYTYNGIVSRKSWIDHVLFDKDNNHLCKIQIVEDVKNKSDHNPITFEYYLNQSHNHTNPINQQKKREFRFGGTTSKKDWHTKRE